MDASTTAVLRSTAKWLVGASAAMAAVLVAGLRLTNLDKLGEADWWLGLLALAAALLAFLAAFTVLYQAARVLATTRATIYELDKRDRDDSVVFPKQRPEPSQDPLLQELALMLGYDRFYIRHLLSDRTTVSAALGSGESQTIRDRTYDPGSPADLAALQNLATDAERRIRAVTDAAERFEIKRNYDRLTSRLIPSGAVFLVGILGFAWLTILYPQRIPTAAPVTTPVQVEITVPTDGAAIRAGLDKTCAGKAITGVDVGGTLNAPVVVTRAQAGCPAYRLDGTRDPHDLIIVPMPAPAPSTVVIVPTPAEPADRCSRWGGSGQRAPLRCADPGPRWGQVAGRG